MELQITASKGIPEGAILSIRAGAVRRQSHITYDRPMQFPSLPLNVSPLKIDVFKPIATFKMDISSDSKDYENVALTDGMFLSFSVKEKLELCGKPSAELKTLQERPGTVSEAGPPAMSRAHEALDARDYLDHHNLLKHVQEMLKFVISEKPTDPYKFMVDYLQKHQKCPVKPTEPRPEGTPHRRFTPEETVKASASDPVVEAQTTCYMSKELMALLQKHGLSAEEVMEIASKNIKLICIDHLAFGALSEEAACSWAKELNLTQRTQQASFVAAWHAARKLMLPSGDGKTKAKGQGAPGAPRATPNTGMQNLPTVAQQRRYALKELGGEEELRQLGELSLQIKHKIAQKLHVAECGWEQDQIYQGLPVGVLFRDSKGAQARLISGCAEMVEVFKRFDLDAEYIVGPVKGVIRSETKVSVKYGGQLCQLSDVVRMTIQINSIGSDILEKTYKCFLEMVDECFTDIRIVHFDDRFQIPLANEYRDFLFLVQVGGVLCEVQVNFVAMMLIKSGAGHGNYEVDRLNDDLMLEAARRGDTSAVKERVKNGARATHMTKSGFSALSFAALHGDHEMAEALLEQLADPLSVGGGDVPIFKALEREYLEVAEVILDSMRELCKPGSERRTFQSDIEMKASILKVWAFLQKKGSQPEGTWKKLKEDFDVVFENICGGVYSGLVWAAKASSESYCVQLLLEKRADANAKIAVKSQWASILDVAASHGALETVRQLVEFRAELGIYSREGWEYSNKKTETGVWKAKDIEEMDYFVDKKGKKRVKYPGQDYFKLKAGWGFLYAETAEEILSKDNGKLLDAYLEATRCQDKWWVNLEETLSIAAKRNAPQVVQVLLHSGARTENREGSLTGSLVTEDALEFVLAVAVQLNATTFLSKFKKTYSKGQIENDPGAANSSEKIAESVPQAIFCEVAKGGNLNLLLKILHQGLLSWDDLMQQNRKEVTKHMEMTAAHLAASEGQLDMIRFLFEKKCSVRHANKSGRTPAGEAARRGHVSMLMELSQDCIWDVTATAFLDGYNKGHGLIAAAGYSGQAETIMALYHKNADVNQASERGDTAAHLTAYSGAIHALKVLLELKCDLCKPNENDQLPVDDTLNKKTEEFLKGVAKQRLKAFLDWKNENREKGIDVPDETEHVGVQEYKGMTMQQAWEKIKEEGAKVEELTEEQEGEGEGEQGTNGTSKAEGDHSAVRSVCTYVQRKIRSPSPNSLEGAKASEPEKDNAEKAPKAIAISIASRKEAFIKKKFEGKNTSGDFAVMMVGGTGAGKSKCVDDRVKAILLQRFAASFQDCKDNYVHLNQNEVFTEVFGDTSNPGRYVDEAHRFWNQLLEDAIVKGYNVIVDDNGTDFKQWTAIAHQLKQPGLGFSKRSVIMVAVLCSSGVALKRLKKLEEDTPGPPIEGYAALDTAIAIYMGMEAPYGSGATPVRFDEIFVYDNNDDDDPLKQIYHENCVEIPKKTQYWHETPEPTTENSEGLRKISAPWWSTCLPQTGLILRRAKDYDNYVQKVVGEYLQKCEDKHGSNNFVLMTAGGPGSGKSSVTKKFMKLMNQHFPSKGCLHYVDLNKDEVLESLFNNEIEYYDQASKVFRDLNARAIEEGFSVVLDGTGRNVQQWTSFADEVREANRVCHQKDAKFRRPVVLLITMATYDTAFKRCVSRLEATGRKVDVPYLKDVYASMPNIIKAYLTTEAWHFDRVFIIDNDDNIKEVDPEKEPATDSTPAADSPKRMPITSPDVKLLYESSVEQDGSPWLQSLLSNKVPGFEDVGGCTNFAEMKLIMDELKKVNSYKENFFGASTKQTNRTSKSKNSSDQDAGFAVFCLSSDGGSRKPKPHKQLVDCYMHLYGQLKEDSSSYLYINESQMTDELNNLLKKEASDEIVKISAEEVARAIRKRAINDESQCHNFALHTSGLRVDKITKMADAVHRADCMYERPKRKVILLIVREYSEEEDRQTLGQIQNQMVQDTDWGKAIASLLGEECFHFDEIAVVDAKFDETTPALVSLDPEALAMCAHTSASKVKYLKYGSKSEVPTTTIRERPQSEHQEREWWRTTYDRLAKKLILHFDVNNTILVADTNVPVSAAINSYLAGVCWGKVVGDGEFLFCSYTEHGHLSLTCPESVDAKESYYKYLERKMKGQPREDFKAAISDFNAHQGIPDAIKKWFDKIWECMKAPDALKDTPFAFQQDGIWFHHIIPSFWQLLDGLQKQGRAFAIVLRTLGKDGPAIAKTINAFAQGEHPEYRHGCSSALLADPPHGCLYRTKDGNRDSFKLEIGNKPLFKPKRQMANEDSQVDVVTIDDEVLIHKHFSELTGTFCVSDDYFYWEGTGFAAAGGKPLWFPYDHADRYFPKEQHIFFDDHIRVHSPANSIVDVRGLECRHGIALFAKEQSAESATKESGEKVVLKKEYREKKKSLPERFELEGESFNVHAVGNVVKIPPVKQEDGTNKEFKVTWDQKDTDGNQKVLELAFDKEEFKELFDIQEWQSKGSASPEIASKAGCLVQAALHESTINPEYFVDEVRRCERLWLDEGPSTEAIQTSAS
eukprot:gnl/MRDRNA2_/MRDRNA2_86685_c0_seq23.p1 gnl/MRDRNA2_/MRDRNA2_86685_c0~~gnl/MRDRNA2_/MRDRNA2_86685_c0_seq23.p1  ORF type:complete len:2537 (-),score=487.72 gnl/MRDRNA2_/MRDRNA2_86685_c0_seq23:240-7850(-)